MKKILIFVIVFFVLNASIKAQYVTIPDPFLRSTLLSRFPTCFNASQMLDTTCTAIVQATTFGMYVADTTINWDGFQYLKNLRVAGFGGSLSPSDYLTLPPLPATLKELSLSTMPTLFGVSLPPALERLVCSYHAAITITSMPSSLKYIDMSGSDFYYMPATLPSSLDTLILFQCDITTLPSLPASLKYLDIGSSSLTTLPALPASLRYLECTMAELNGALPILPDSLATLYANTNNITFIPNLPSSLRTLSLSGNLGLGSLPVLPANLEYLDVHYTGLNNLTNLPDGLGFLDCSESLLSSLPPIPAGLYYLNCAATQLNCLPVIPSGNTGTIITIDDRITCIPNRPSPAYTLRVTHFSPYNPDIYTTYTSNTFPLCNATNNVNGCEPYPRMKGYVYNDNNNNGVKDANEPYRPNIKIQLSNGTFTLTNSNGSYQIAADNIGNYSLAIASPNHYTSAPLQYNYNFNSYDTVVTNNFALQATASVDSLSISVLQVSPAARPGFSYVYEIPYQNAGTTTLTPNIVFNYDNSRLTYNTSSNAAVINNGSSLSLAETALVAGEQKNLVAYFTVKPTAVIGDSLKANVSIHANAVTATNSAGVVIRGSYDPNDKSATPALTTEQVANGDYIYYTICFQNTGTDTAFNIVIADSLNGKLQPSSLQVINTSHPARVTVNGDMVYFEFLNIHLPDSNVNELQSHGFVTFKIKPQPTVTTTSIIPNKAAIYFDYNPPVFTAEAQTLIYDASPSAHNYIFTGTGNWTSAANWTGGVVPPSTLQSGDHVVIDGSCILNIVVTANAGSSINVVTGKSLFVQGNLVVQ